MKRYKISAIIISLVVGSLFTTGCYDTNYLIYEKDYSGVFFGSDSVQYSFGVTPIEIREHTLHLPLQIMGVTSPVARTVEYEVIPDTTTADDGVQYHINEAIIPADSVSGYISVTLLRDGLEGNYSEGYKRYKLGLQLKANENFEPTLNISNQIIVLHFDNAIEQPAWYDYKNDKVWSESILGKWHPLKLIKMVEYFHELENILPETYRKIAAAYGENLESIPYGDPYQYKTTFNKYIYAPMYEYFSNPDNHDEIVSLYPDFPFDFPNPFAGNN
ncbi:MAG: DUF4843 domain-containing protein [Coprobacter sp.]|nr:DUF4843 domain-containing protein [Coprobacter sp.]